MSVRALYAERLLLLSVVHCATRVTSSKVVGKIIISNCTQLVHQAQQLASGAVELHTDSSVRKLQCRHRRSRGNRR
jgi:hypothetical protein